MKNKEIIATMALLGGLCLQATAQSVVVDSLEFDKAMATSPAVLLQGKVAGVRVSSVDGNISGAVNTNIRGINALRGDSQPLWIVDGVIINASLNDNNNAFYQFGEKSYTSPLNALAYINEYDIESIEVIKDLSAAALYGARGANGVIIVKTKLPKSGDFNIDWNANAGISTSEYGRTAFSHNNSISLNGASGQTKYNVSAFYRKLQGTVSGNENIFGGLRAKFDTHANSVVWFGMDATFTMGDMSSASGVSYFGQPSLTLGMRKDGFFPSDTKDGWAADYDDDAFDRRATSSMYVSINFTPSLSLRTTVGLDFQNNNRYIWYGNGTSFGLENNGAASMLGTSVFKYVGKSVLSWNRFIGKDHKVKIEGGVEASGDMYKYNTINGTDFFSHILRAKGISLAASNPSLHKYDHDYFTWGVFADASYAFKGIAGANFILRADSTPRYDDGMNIYKAASVFFDVKNALLSSCDEVSTLKLNVGYGEAGREQYVPYGMFGNFVPGTYPTVEQKYETFYEGFNRIRSTEFNAGIEFGILADRVKVGFGYYDKQTEDTFNAYCFGQLGSGSYLWEFCDRKDFFNQTSTVANRGLEGEISAQIINTKNIKWSVAANGAYNVNQMLDVDVADLSGKSVGSKTSVNANTVGQPVGAFVGYKTNADGSFKDLSGNGKVDKFDQDIIGNPVPKFFGGLSTSFQYGNFSAEVYTDAAFGFDIINLNDLLFNEAAPYRISDKYVEKGDFFRIGRVSLGYNIPMSGKCFIKAFRVSASALNLCTFTGYSGWNPDVNCFGTSALTTGVDYGSYPAARSFVLGLSLKF